MRCKLLAVFVMVAATAHGADDAPKATVTLDGKKVMLPEKRIADGVKATVGVLESCCDESLYQADELKKAEEGEHVRLVFDKPITVTVMNEKVEVSEVFVHLPMNTGVLWVKSGDKVKRYAKFEHLKVKPFTDWVEEARLAK